MSVVSVNAPLYTLIEHIYLHIPSWEFMGNLSACWEKCMCVCVFVCVPAGSDTAEQSASEAAEHSLNNKHDWGRREEVGTVFLLLFLKRQHRAWGGRRHTHIYFTWFYNSACEDIRWWQWLCKLQSADPKPALKWVWTETIPSLCISVNVRTCGNSRMHANRRSFLNYCIHSWSLQSSGPVFHSGLMLLDSSSYHTAVCSVSVCWPEPMLAFWSPC